MEEERLVMSGFREEEDDQESSLRPKTLREYVGQQAVKDSLNIYIQAARQRRDSLDHILLYGPPGLGKSDTALLDQVNSILSGIDSDTRAAMWQAAVDGQPQ